MKAAATAPDATARALPTPACVAPRQNPQQVEALLASASIQRDARLRLQQFADGGRSGASQGGSP